MDPLSHAVTGSLLAQSLARRPEIRAAALLGALAGMAPDLDILVSSPTDPLLQIEYHRHFSHALAFVPIGALLCALIALALQRLARLRPVKPGKDPLALSTLSFSRIYLFCLLGYLQGGLLDACTSYGTQLFWPFSEARMAWSNIAIIDPLYTLPLLVLALLATLRRQPKIAWVGLLWMTLYLSLGFLQKHRAEAAGAELAQQRGLSIDRLEAKPTIFNNILYRVLAQSGDTYYVDAIRVGWFSKPIIYEGSTVAVPTDYYQNAPEGSQLRHDLKRFAHFSGQWVYFVDDDPQIIGDLRYSMLPHSTEPLWAIGIDRDTPDSNARLQTHRKADSHTRQQLLDMLKATPDLP